MQRGADREEVAGSNFREDLECEVRICRMRRIAVFLRRCPSCPAREAGVMPLHADS